MDLEALKNATFQFMETELKFIVTEYTNNKSTAIQLVSNDVYEEPFCMLTVNVPESKLLKENEILIKNWSENEGIAKEAFKTGLFEDTGKSIPTGYCEAPIWKIK